MKMNNKPVIILDAGHGGINPVTGKYVTPGKRSPVWDDGSQYFEGVGNRKIARLVSQYLRSAGWKVLYTVNPSDWRDMSLGERIKASNGHFADNPNAFQISIHSNAYKKNIGQGAEVWTSIGLTESDVLATIWMDEHIKLFPELTIRSSWADGDVDKEGNLAMNKVHCPSVLIETMFHSNEEQCRILMSKEGKEKIAIAIAEAAIRFNQQR